MAGQAPDFETAMRNIGDGVQRALSTGDVNAAAPQPAPAPAAAPAAAQPQPPPPVEAPPAAPMAVQPAPAAAPAPTAEAPRFLTVDQFGQYQQQIGGLLQGLWAQNNALAQAAQRGAPTPPPATEEPRLPSALDLTRSFIAPERNTGETDQQYAVRAQAAVLDHVNQGVVSHVEKRAEAMAQAAVQRYADSIAATQQQERGQRAFNEAAAETVRRAGVDPGSEAGAYISDMAKRSVVAMVTAGETQGWRPEHYVAQLGREVARIKARTVVPPAPGAAPQLAIVPPQPAAPIGGSGGGGPPAQPASAGEGAPAKTFEEAMERVRLGVVRAVKQGS